jgi:hypothetical protein
MTFFNQLAINPELIPGLSKFMYLLTIIWGWRVWYDVFRLRHDHMRIYRLWVVQSTVMPGYSIFAVLYALDIYYHSAVGYFGWAFINTLFISTDRMMSATLSRVIKERRALEKQLNTLAKQPNTG